MDMQRSAKRATKRITAQLLGIATRYIALSQAKRMSRNGNCKLKGTCHK